MPTTAAKPKRAPRYKLAYCGSMTKEIGVRESRMCGIDGFFKTVDALEAAVHDTVGWRTGMFDEINVYRKRVSLREWELAK